MIALCLPSLALAQKFDQNVKLGDIGPIYIQIIDGARNGCWTNIKEVKNYASDKIELLGGTLTDDIDVARFEGAAFSISITAERLDSVAVCYGSVRVKVESLSLDINDFKTVGMFVYSEAGSAAASGNNLNNMILDVLQKALSEWEQ